MRWDFSIRQQAEDRWQEIRAAADEQRRLRLIQKAGRAPRIYAFRSDSARAVIRDGAARFRKWVKGAA